MRVLAVVAVLAAALGGIFYLLRSRTLAPAEPQGATIPSAMSQRVELKTKDNVAIVGDYYPSTSLGAGAPAKGLLLLHMMPADRTSWRAFAEKMQAAGWHALAIDLRGHGQSQGGPSGYKSFSDTEHQASRWDVEAGVEFLKEALRQSSGYKGEIYLGGASIGANLALQYLAEHPEVKAAFLLSPGLDYRGVKTEAAAGSLKSGQSIFYIASRDDSHSADTIQRLYDITPAGVRKEIKFFETAGHGTTIFEREPQFMATMVRWLQDL